MLNNLEGVYQDLRERVSTRKPPKPAVSGGLEISPLDKGGEGGSDNHPKPAVSGGLENEPPKSPLSGGLATVTVELTDFSVFYSQDSSRMLSRH